MTAEIRVEAKAMIKVTLIALKTAGLEKTSVNQLIIISYLFLR